MELTVGSRLKHAWNAFLNRAPTANYQYGIGGGYAYRPDRFRLTRGNERSIVTSVYNRQSHPYTIESLQMQPPLTFSMFSWMMKGGF